MTIDKVSFCSSTFTLARAANPRLQCTIPLAVTRLESDADVAFTWYSEELVPSWWVEDPKKRRLEVGSLVLRFLLYTNLTFHEGTERKGLSGKTGSLNS